MKKNINKAGFWAGITAFTATASYGVIQLLQIAGAIRYPADEVLIYGTSLCIVIPFLLEMLALHYITPDEKRFWSHAAVVFATLYSVFVTANYIVQLGTVIPATLTGAADDVRILQQTPHSMFWFFDALGYIFMGIATRTAIPVFERHGFQKWVRAAFLANAFVTPLIATVYFYPRFSEKLLFLGSPWIITAPASMLLLAILFKRNLNAEERSVGSST